MGRDLQRCRAPCWDACASRDADGPWLMRSTLWPWFPCIRSRSSAVADAGPVPASYRWPWRRSKLEAVAAGLADRSSWRAIGRRLTSYASASSRRPSRDRPRKNADCPAGQWVAELSANRGRPSSGMGSQGATLATNWCRLGRTPGSASKAPSRTPRRWGSEGWRLKTADPQSPQNHFSHPLSGRHARSLSSPETILNEPGCARAATDAPVPVRRWQRVQWQ